MKKTYSEPIAEVYMLKSRSLLVQISNENVDDSEKSNKFDSSSKSLLWEDDDMETENKE